MVLQISQEPLSQPSVRGDRFQIFVPQGWKTLNDGGYVLLGHSSGASLLVQRINRPGNLPEYAQRQAERVMLPLGFAKLGEPQSFKEGKDEWIQYEILGNRLAAHRGGGNCLLRSSHHSGTARPTSAALRRLIALKLRTKSVLAEIWVAQQRWFLLRSGGPFQLHFL
jgi:hypothetical protein